MRLASICSSSHFAFGLFLARLRAARRHCARPLALLRRLRRRCVSPPVLVVALRPRHLRYPSWSLYISEDAGGFASRGARPIARPFSSPALPSPLSCFRPSSPAHLRQQRRQRRAYDAKKKQSMSGENAKTNSNWVMQVELGKKNAQPPPPSTPLSPSLRPSHTPQSSSL
ncbi:hypothetical protein Syun_030102 [Stephania yunnanensis]|uniref:Uncharacterized protein n=1 Tax=Stephania yunnanensis TaxID=152371 RepID=A0AAP0E9W9_9MAGN